MNSTLDPTVLHSPNKTILVTGSNRGIGLEFVGQYLADGSRVIACYLASEEHDALRALAACHPHTLRLQALDATDWQAVQRLERELQDETIDLLICNAGIRGPNRQSLGDLDPNAWLQVTAVNAIAPIKLIEILLPKLREQGAVIACLSSASSSLTQAPRNRDNYYYRSSKAMLNAAIQSLAADLAGKHIVVLLNPGWVSTAMGGPGATLSAGESVSSMRRILVHLYPEDSGRFLRYDGRDQAW